MKKSLLAVSVSIVLTALAGTAQAGCGKGALVGGAAGHLAGKHAVVGAAAGCAIGSHMSKKKATAASQQTAPAAPAK